MAKEELIEILNHDENYVWSLFFLKKDKRNKIQPFSTYKKRYKNQSQLDKYVKNALKCICTLQLSKIENIEKYNGMNASIVCNYIPLDDTLISDKWEKLLEAVINSSSNALSGKICGYIVCGEPINEAYLPITLMKFSSPIISLTNNKTITYRETLKMN